MGCRCLGLPRAPLCPGTAWPAAPGHTGVGRSQLGLEGEARHTRLSLPSSGRVRAAGLNPESQTGIDEGREGWAPAAFQVPQRRRGAARLHSPWHAARAGQRGAAGGLPEPGGSGSMLAAGWFGRKGPGGGSPTRSSITVNQAACASRTRLLRRRGRTETRAEDAQTRVSGTPRRHRTCCHLSNPTSSFSPSQPAEPPAPVSPQLCPAPSIRPSVRVRVCVCVHACRCPRGGQPRAPSLSAGSQRSGGGGLLFLPSRRNSASLSCISLFFLPWSPAAVAI